MQSIDAPEIDGKCAFEKDLAQRAKHRLNEILSSEPFSVSPSGKDRYGRTLAAIYNRNGEVGAAMVREGLARAWVGRRMNAFAIVLLTLLGAAGESLGRDRHLKINTTKRRTNSLFRQGCMLYELIPNMPARGRVLVG